ncbi:hypothetical protein [Clavibacter michiganensis]|uniref:hypothetical protein n=1 Tax=Clavibacter michiganensis TaxID=28447 RepID=UPI001D0A6763|nr:hypothetical protein [Clavibacter michiganensis]UDM12290.1 hypothetical protein LHJ49_15695 [Clavibacter michiganensis subsp. michiganensis]
MTDEKRERPTCRMRRTPRPAPDLGRDPIDVPTPPTATTDMPQEPDVQSGPAPAAAQSPNRSVTVQLPKRDVTVQLGTRVGVRTKDLLDYVKATQDQDIRVSIELAVEAMFGHLLPTDESSS